MRCYHQSRRGQDITEKDYNDLEDWSNGEGFDSVLQAGQACCWGSGIARKAIPAQEAIRWMCLGQGKTHATNHKAVTNPWYYTTREESNAKNTGRGLGKQRAMTDLWGYITEASTRVEKSYFSKRTLLV